MKYEVSEVKDLNIEVKGGATVVTLNGKQIVLTEGEKLVLELAPGAAPEIQGPDAVPETVRPEGAEPKSVDYDDYYDSEFKREKRSESPAATAMKPDSKDSTSAQTESGEKAMHTAADAQAASHDNVVRFESKKERERKSAAEDFAAALKISLTNFRGSRRIFKSLKNTWYDKQLQSAIHKIDGTGLSYLILIIGAAVIMLLGSQRFGTPVTAALVIAFILLDVLFINPLLLYMVAPKPIKSHIKQIDKLDAYDRAIYEEELKEIKVSRTTKRAIDRHDEKGNMIYKDRD